MFGIPKEVCCYQYCKAVIEYSNTCGKITCLKEIHFMDKEPGMIQMIQAEFSLHLPLDIWLVLLSKLPEERLP
jgi:hypothetical protein